MYITQICELLFCPLQCLEGMMFWSYLEVGAWRDRVNGCWHKYKKVLNVNCSHSHIPNLTYTHTLQSVFFMFTTRLI